MAGKDRENQDASPKDPILDELRNLYDDVAAEPLPDRLLDLLDKLDEAERKR